MDMSYPSELDPQELDPHIPQSEKAIRESIECLRLCDERILKAQELIQMWRSIVAGDPSFVVNATCVPADDREKSKDNHRAA
jgi:hypothetical protein